MWVWLRNLSIVVGLIGGVLAIGANWTRGGWSGLVDLVETLWSAGIEALRGEPRFEPGMHIFIPKGAVAGPLFLPGGYEVLMKSDGAFDFSQLPNGSGSCTQIIGFGTPVDAKFYIHGCANDVNVTITHVRRMRE
jgi:hypothetical protein